MRIKVALVMLFIFLQSFVGCGKSTSLNSVPNPNSKDEAQKPQDPKQPPKVDPSPTPQPDDPFELSFQNVNKRVFSTSCVSCHSKQQDTVQGKLSLDTYAEVKENILRIYLEVVITKRMPLQNPLTKDQYTLLKAWLEADSPEVATKAN
ncbi:MAG: hypothetical protein ACXVCP_10180 [Bdellovibrio sp.]